jgi:hypothetical protein
MKSLTEVLHGDCLRIQKYSNLEYNESMKWHVEEHGQYTEWFEEQAEELQDEILAVVGLLQREGPTLSRPYADTLKGSQHSNMKELRVQYQGEPWRILFAFDPRRFAILLVGGNKTGNARWYKESILIADKRFTEHLESLQDDKEKVKDDNTRRKNGSTDSRKKGKNRGKNQ